MVIGEITRKMNKGEVMDLLRGKIEVHQEGMVVARGVTYTVKRMTDPAPSHFKLERSDGRYDPKSPLPGAWEGTTSEVAFVLQCLAVGE